jgi:predicted dehydrogenase
MTYASQSVLLACASREREKSRQFANQHGIARSYGSYESLLADPEIDVIYVATPHSFHEEQVLASLEAGKHVLCEKPMGVNRIQVQAMTVKAREKGLFLMEAMWTGVLPMVLDVRQKISQGAIGEVRRITADFGFQFGYDAQSRVYNPSLAGGSMLDIGIYPLYLALSILGMPELVQSSVTKAPTGTDSECSIQLRYPNGATAALFSCVTCHTPTECIISGTKGILRIPARFHEQERYTIDYNDGRHEDHHTGKKGYGYTHEIDHVWQCLAAGIMESPILTHQTSIDLVSIMDAIRKQHDILYPFE